VGHTQSVTEHGKDSANELGEDGALNQAGCQLRELVASFANVTSPTITWDAANHLVQDSRNEPNSASGSPRSTTLRKTLLEPGFILEPACNNEAHALCESGCPFYDDKYKGHFDNPFMSAFCLDRRRPCRR
jgi:hypothetical protein